MKVVISARNFVFDGCDAVQRLTAAGFEVVDITEKQIENEDDYYNEICDAEAVINAFEPMSAELISRCERLKLISVRGVGYDYIDAEACKKAGVAITRTVGTVGGAVSEQVLACMLHFARELETMNAYMQNGSWTRIMTEGLKGKTLGIIGFGEIGKALAKKAEAFDMKIRYYCTAPKSGFTYEFTPLDKLLAESDYVVLAVSLNDGTRNMLDERALSLMKSNAVLINVARAGVVDTKALRQALMRGRIHGAAVDVFEKEPCTDSILSGLDNVILTPHTAPFTRENFIDMNNLASQNVIDFFDGRLDEKYLAK